MILNIYEYVDYRKLFLEAMRIKAPKARGQRASLAAFLKCQPTYISHVLSSRSDFSLEQAEAACRYFEFSDAATNYSILLVSYARAGTKALQQHYRNKIDELRQQAQEVKRYVGEFSALSAADRSRYYSTWQYGAIHMLLTVEGYSDIATISQRLRIPLNFVAEAIDFFRSCGLVQIVEGQITVLKESLHLDRHAPEIFAMHSSHRLKALSTLAESGDENLHFSTYFSCQKADLPKLKKLFLTTIENCAHIIKHSTANTVGAINIDFFEL